MLSDEAIIPSGGISSWLESFRAEPLKYLDELLWGYAIIPPYAEAEPAELVRILIGSVIDPQSDISKLDRALVTWLKETRCNPVPAAVRQRDRAARVVSNAYDLVHSLDLRASAAVLRQEFDQFLSWSDALSVQTGTDARAAFLSTVALTQQLLSYEDDQYGLELEPYWLTLCGAAGEEFPEEYLALGLLGLRMLPDRAGFPSERPWMSGLANWAARQDPTVEIFGRTWEYLKSLYPRPPRYWRRALAATLAQEFSERIPPTIVDFWKSGVGLDDVALPDIRTSLANFDIAIRQVDEVVRVVDQPINLLRSRVNALVAARLRYAEVTGDAFPLCATVGRVGKDLLRAGLDTERVERGLFVAGLVRSSLRWQPQNFFLWALWRDALFNAGELAAAENVGWEGVRRFPEDRLFYSHFAEHLTHIPGREAVAETLLREAILRFPADPVLRTQLALFLTSFPPRHDEAEKIYFEAIRLAPTDPFPRSQLAELLVADKRVSDARVVIADAENAVSDQRAFLDLQARIAFSDGDASRAREILEQGVDRYPSDRVLRKHLSDLKKGEPLKLHSLAYGIWPEHGQLQPSKILAASAVDRTGRLRRILGRLRTAKLQLDREEMNAMRSEVNSIIELDPFLPFAQFVHDLTTDNALSDQLPTMFEVAFAKAVIKEDVRALEKLEVPFSRRRLMDLARLYLMRDEAAASRLSAWLSVSSITSSSRMEQALRTIVLRRLEISSERESGHISIEAISQLPANDVVLVDLIDLVFMPTDLPVAA